MVKVTEEHLKKTITSILKHLQIWIKYNEKQNIIRKKTNRSSKDEKCSIKKKIYQMGLISD